MLRRCLLPKHLQLLRQLLCRHDGYLWLGISFYQSIFCSSTAAAATTAVAFTTAPNPPAPATALANLSTDANHLLRRVRQRLRLRQVPHGGEQNERQLPWVFAQLLLPNA